LRRRQGDGTWRRGDTELVAVVPGDFAAIDVGVSQRADPARVVLLRKNFTADAACQVVANAKIFRRQRGASRSCGQQEGGGTTNLKLDEGLYLRSGAGTCAR
jgi:hypothetical protein